MNKLTNTNHVPVLDSLRGLAAMLVCIYHFVIGPIDFINDKQVLTVFGYGKYGVQLFFVISGFVIPWSLSYKKYELKSFFKFLIKRFIRLEPPYIFSIFLVIILYVLRHVFLNEVDSRNFSITQVALHFGYLIPFFENYNWINKVYWTLAIEFQFYIFIGIIYFAITSNQFWIRLLFYVVALAAHFFTSNQFLLYWIPVFLLGNLLFQMKRGIIGKLEFYTLTIISLVFICVFMNLPVFVSSVIPVIAILYFEKFNSFIGNWLGKISYSIYLIHTIIGSAVINILSHHASSSLGKFFIIVLGVIVTIISSYISYLLIEKQSQKYSQKLNY